MTETTSTKRILTLAWPVIVARSSQAVIGFADALMCAPLGEESLAAATAGAMNIFAVTILPMGIVFIGQSYAAQLMGQGRLTVAVRYAWYGLLLAAGMSVVAALAVPAVSPILSRVGYAVGVHRAMTSYLEIRLLGVGAVLATEALGNWYGGLGNTRPHMQAGLVAMVSNVALNWLFIGGNLGAPAMGVAGAALASVLASFLGAAWILVVFFLRHGLETGDGLEIPDVRPRQLRWSEARSMVRYGLPQGGNWFLEFASFVVFINVIMGGLGTTVLAAMMVVMSINSLSFMPAFGLATAGAILSGQAIGRKAHAEVATILKRTLLLALAWQGSVGLAYFFAPAPLMALFATHRVSGELIAIGETMLGLSALWQLFDAAGITLGETLRSAGDTAWTLAARLILAWVVFIPASWISVRVFGGGYVAALLCILLYIGLLAVVFSLRFLSRAWERIDITRTEPDVQ